MKLFAFWLGLIGLIVGAIFGAIDLDFLGALVGALIGGLVGTLIGQALDLVIVPFFGDKEDRTFGKWVLRLIGLALVVVVVHELYWAANFVSLAATHNVGARTIHHVNRGDSQQALQDTLRGKRWQVAIFAARPLAWGVRDDIKAVDRTTLNLIDDVVAGRSAVNPPLALRGRTIMQNCEALLDRYMQRTWLLRFLPREMLIPKE
jgi:hypothetical protein